MSPITIDHAGENTHQEGASSKGNTTQDISASDANDNVVHLRRQIVLLEKILSMQEEQLVGAAEPKLKAIVQRWRQEVFRAMLAQHTAHERHLSEHSKFMQQVITLTAQLEGANTKVEQLTCQNENLLEEASLSQEKMEEHAREKTLLLKQLQDSNQKYLQAENTLEQRSQELKDLTRHVGEVTAHLERVTQEKNNLEAKLDQATTTLAQWKQSQGLPTVQASAAKQVSPNCPDKRSTHSSMQSWSTALQAPDSQSSDRQERDESNAANIMPEGMIPRLASPSSTGHTLGRAKHDMLPHNHVSSSSNDSQENYRRVDSDHDSDGESDDAASLLSNVEGLIARFRKSLNESGSIQDVESNDVGSIAITPSSHEPLQTHQTSTKEGNLGQTPHTHNYSRASPNATQTSRMEFDSSPRLQQRHDHHIQRYIVQPSEPAHHQQHTQKSLADSISTLLSESPYYAQVATTTSSDSFKEGSDDSPTFFPPSASHTGNRRLSADPDIIETRFSAHLATTPKRVVTSTSPTNDSDHNSTIVEANSSPAFSMPQEPLAQTSPFNSTGVSMEAPENDDDHGKHSNDDCSPEETPRGPTPSKSKSQRIVLSSDEFKQHLLMNSSDPDHNDDEDEDNDEADDGSNSSSNGSLHSEDVAPEASFDAQPETKEATTPSGHQSLSSSFRLAVDFDNTEQINPLDMLHATTQGPADFDDTRAFSSDTEEGDDEAQALPEYSLHTARSNGSATDMYGSDFDAESKDDPLENVSLAKSAASMYSSLVQDDDGQAFFRGSGQPLRAMHLVSPSPKTSPVTSHPSSSPSHSASSGETVDVDELLKLRTMSAGSSPKSDHSLFINDGGDVEVISPAFSHEQTPNTSVSRRTSNRNNSLPPSDQRNQSLTHRWLQDNGQTHESGLLGSTTESVPEDISEPASSASKESWQQHRANPIYERENPPHRLQSDSTAQEWPEIAEHMERAESETSRTGYDDDIDSLLSELLRSTHTLPSSSLANTATTPITPTYKSLEAEAMSAPHPQQPEVEDGPFRLNSKSDRASEQTPEAQDLEEELDAFMTGLLK